jgi:molybdenum cofactor synthesis domain-containing protein
VSELPRDARAVVLTASNRASAGVYEDTSGQLLAEGLAALGFAVEGPHVHPDDVAELERALRDAVAGGADVVVTTGGTGLSPTDVTPEATRAVLEREAPTAVLSRGLAGTAGRTLVVNLPGSKGGVRDGLAVLGPLLPHLVSQLRGGDHPREA